MKRTWIVVLALSLILVFGQIAFAAGITLIPGSRDGEGALGEDGKSWGTIRGTTNIIMEGATSDAYEATITVPDPGSDITYTFPATTGTLSLVGGAGGTLADGKIYIGNNVGGTETALGQTMSGDATIANTGALTLALNAVGTRESNVNTVSVTVASAGTYGTATVTSGSTVLGHYGFANTQSLDMNGITNITIASTTMTVVINGTAGDNAVVHKVVVLEP